MSQRTPRQGQGRGQRSGLWRFTVDEVAQVTGLGVRTIRRHVAAGALQTTRVGGRVYVTPQDGRAWWGRDLPIGNLEPSPAWRVVPIRVYAAITGMTARQVRHLVDKGALRTRKIGGRIFVEHSELVAALDNSATHNR